LEHIKIKQTTRLNQNKSGHKIRTILTKIKTQIKLDINHGIHTCRKSEKEKEIENKRKYQQELTDNKELRPVVVSPNPPKFLTRNILNHVFS